ncbi:MAG: TetR/AcrR family transcriptional regulator [Specibacter sp.]
MQTDTPTPATAPAKTDPRASRSSAALRRAILHLAELQPLASITVDQVVTEAKVSRKTFYNHVGNPTELLAAALTEELDHVRVRMDRGLASNTSDLAALSRVRLGEIVEHILLRRRIYQQPDGHIQPQLFRLLADHFYEAIRYSLTQQLRQLPTTGPQPGLADIHAGFVAHAYAGAIDAWLPHADTISPDTFLTEVIRSLPDWMTTRR